MAARRVLERTSQSKSFSRKRCSTLGDLALHYRYLFLTIASVAANCINGGALDWPLLRQPGPGIFGGAGLDLYANKPSLQAGPPSIALVDCLDAASFGHGLRVGQILMALALPAMLRVVERSSPTSGQESASGSAWRILPLPGLIFTAAWAIGTGLAWLPVVLLLVCVGAAAIALAEVRFAAQSDRRELLILVVGVSIVPAWSDLAGATAHIEDVVAVFAVLLASRALLSHRAMSGGALLGLAIAFKTWAVAAAPLVLLVRRRSRCGFAFFLAMTVPLVFWLPFVLHNHGTLRVGSQRFVVSETSTVALLGLHGPAPGWVRPVELLGCLLSPLLALRSAAAYDALATGFAARLLLDPATFPYYASSVIAVAVIADLYTARSPWRSILACQGLWFLPYEQSRYALFGTTGASELRTVVLFVLITSWILPRVQPDADGRRRTQDYSICTIGVSRQVVHRPIPEVSMSPGTDRVLTRSSVREGTYT